MDETAVHPSRAAFCERHRARRRHHSQPRYSGNSCAHAPQQRSAPSAPLEVFPTRNALLIPKTDDGRVLFAVPWFDRLLIGTTEQEVTIHDELYLSKADVEYLLHHINRYFRTAIRAEQIVSGFAGARPLVSVGGSRDTKKLARDHEVELDAQSGLISIMGGKWTT